MTDNDPMPTDPPTSADATPPEPPRKRRRLRRLLKIVLLVVLLLAILTAVAPYALSTGPGTRLVVAIANSQLRGAIDIEDLSLGWFSPTRIRGLRLFDPQGRLVVETESIDSDLSAWAAMLHPEAFGQLAVRSAAITLYEIPEGGFSIATLGPAPKPDDEEEEDDEPDKPSPEPHGRVLLENASVEMVRLSGHRLKIIDIHTAVDVTTSTTMNGETSFALASGGKLELRYDLDRLKASDPLDRRVRINLATPEPIDLAPIVRFATGNDALAGHLTLTGDVANDQPEGSVDLRIQVDQLRAELDGRAVNPIDITLALVGESHETDIKASLGLTTSAGNASLTFQLSDPAAWRAISSDTFMAAVLDGEPMNLPPLLLNGNSDINLPRIAEALPGLIKLPRDATLTDGKLNSTMMLSTRPVGIDVPAPVPLYARGSFHLADITLDQPATDERPARTVRWPDTTSEFTAMLLEGTGLTVQQADLDTGFASATASGTAKKLQANARIDLAAMWKQLGTVVDLGEKQLAGTAAFNAAVDAADTLQINTLVRSDLRDLQFTTPDRDVALKHITLHVPVTVIRREDRKNGKKTKTLEAVKWHDVAFTINDAAAIRSTGFYSGESGDLQARTDIDEQDLAAFADLARAMGSDVPDEIAGRLTLNTFVHVPGNEAMPVKAAYDMTLNDLAVCRPQQTLRLAEFTMRGTDIQYTRDSQAAQALVVFGVREVTVVTTSKDATAETTQTLSIPTLGGQAGMEHLSELAQQKFSADFDIDDLLIIRGEQNIPFGKLEFEAEGLADRTTKVIRIDELQLQSQPITVALTGANTISNYDTTRDLRLQGEFAGQWQRVMDLVYAVKPSLNDEDEIVVSFAGSLAPSGTTDEKGTFTVTGPARQPDVQPVFRGVDGGTALGWSSGSVAGLELGPAAIRPELKGGMLALNIEPITASEGMLRPGGTIDFTGEQPVYRLPGEVKVIENVNLKPEIGTQLLSRINPVFGKLVGLEGKMSLTLRDLDLPLGEALKTSGRGSGTLDLSSMSVKSRSGLLDALVGMWGAASGDFQKVRVEGVDFAIKDGRIHYDNFRMIFGEDFDLLFRGSVGFDDTLDLWVSVPVHAGVLRAFKISDSVADVANLLQQMGVRIEIPIRGTRLSPKLEFDRQRIDKLVAEAMKKLAEKQIQDALFRLIQQGLQSGE